MKALKFIALAGMLFLMGACSDKNDKLIDALEDTAAKASELEERVNNNDMSAVDEYSKVIDKFTDDYSEIIKVYSELSDAQKERVKEIEKTLKK